MTDPFGSFDDATFAAIYEAVSPILIVSNRGPTLFKNNTFSENIGTLGGAVHIYAPDFETNVNITHNTTNAYPYNYFADNKFLKNMAYFAGNAIYMTHTVYRETNYKDHKYMCGAGVHLEGNEFRHNVGLKRHNGGATVHRCQVYNENFKQSRLKTTSSLQLAERNKTDTDNLEPGQNFTHFYEDPLTTYDYFYDAYTNKTKYKLLKYNTHIKYNTFYANAAGMKGSAVLVSYINSVEIEDNTFYENGPMTSFAERSHSPYYKYFAKGQKLISYNAVPTAGCPADIDNEFSYIYLCWTALSYIDLPAVKGALYLEQCQDDFRCFAPVG